MKYSGQNVLSLIIVRLLINLVESVSHVSVVVHIITSLHTGFYQVEGVVENQGKTLRDGRSC
jgi:hypothetical protein